MIKNIKEYFQAKIGRKIGILSLDWKKQYSYKRV